MDRLIDALKQVEGAYSLVVLTEEGLIACRDPLGIRPLVMGKLGEATIFASETRRARRHRRHASSATSTQANWSSSTAPASAPSARSKRRSRARASSSTSISRGRIRSSTARRSTKSARTSAPNCRAKLRSRPTSSCRCPTAAFRRRSASARKAGIPFELGIIRSHYVGRTFIQPSQEVRHLGVKLKHNANSAPSSAARASS